MRLIRTIARAIVRAIRRFFTSTTDDIISDIENKITKLNAVIDVENEASTAATERRLALRAAIDATYADQRAAELRADRASVIRGKLVNLIDA